MAVSDYDYLRDKCRRAPQKRPVLSERDMKSRRLHVHSSRENCLHQITRSLDSYQVAFKFTLKEPKIPLGPPLQKGEAKQVASHPPFLKGGRNSVIDNYPRRQNLF